MLQLGLQTALTEITLVLFTTLAPSGIVAFVICACMVGFDRTLGLDRQRLIQGLWLPIIVVLVGLVASATHLGNPANALFVFMGVGRSPLSNEVTAGVVFLALAGGLWLYAFVRKPRVTLVRVWAIAAVVAALFFLRNIAFAYNADTVITWHTPLVPAMLVSNALVGGPMLAVLTIDVCGYLQERRSFASPRFVRDCALVSCPALAVGMLLIVAYGTLLHGSANSMASADEILPLYVAGSVAYLVLAMAGIVIVKRAHDRMPVGETIDARFIRRIAVAIVLILVGTFFTRFLFYMAHMTVGV